MDTAEMNPADVKLSAGCVEKLISVDAGEESLLTQSYTLQILSVKKMGTDAAPRYRVIFSDGVTFTQAMLASPLNTFVENHRIQKNCILQIDRFSVNNIQAKRVLIIMSVTVLGQCSEKIGNPQQSAATPAVGQTPATTPATTAPAHPPAGPSNTSNQTRKINSVSQSHRKGAALFPIEALSPYQNNWVIKARVLQKSDIKTFSNKNGDGRLFNVTFMDETGEIRGTAWNTVVDDLFPKLEEGKAYFVSKARVNLAKKKFSNVNNDYELGLDRNTEIEECTEADVPAIKYNFVPLGMLNECAKDSTIDVIGIVKEVSQVSSITTKQSKPLAKRELTLVDQSGYSVKLTLWAKHADDFNHFDQPVIAFKGVKVSDFQGRSLSMMGTSMMTIDPQISEAYSVRGWFDNQGSTQEFQNQGSGSGGSTFSGGFDHESVIPIQMAKDSGLGSHDKADVFSCRGTVTHVKTEGTLMYPACQNADCSRKLIEAAGSWRCEKCDTSFPEPRYRYIVSSAISDWSGQAWLQGFNDVGEALFGMTANEFHALQEEEGEAMTRSVLGNGGGKRFNFVVRAKTETYQDNSRLRYSILRMYPLSYKDECQQLLSILHSSWGKQ